MMLMPPLQLYYGPRHQTGSPFAFDEFTILAMPGLVWFVILDLGQLALLRFSRWDKSVRVSGAGFAVLCLIISCIFMAQSISEANGRPITENIDTPAEALAMVMGACLILGVVLTLLIDLLLFVVQGRVQIRYKPDMKLPSNREREEAAPEAIDAKFDTAEGSRASPKPKATPTVVRY